MSVMFRSARQKHGSARYPRCRTATAIVAGDDETVKVSNVRNRLGTIMEDEHPIDDATDPLVGTVVEFLLNSEFGKNASPEQMADFFRSVDDEVRRRRTENDDSHQLSAYLASQRSTSAPAADEESKQVKQGSETVQAPKEEAGMKKERSTVAEPPSESSISNNMHTVKEDPTGNDPENLPVLFGPMTVTDQSSEHSSQNSKTALLPQHFPTSSFDETQSSNDDALTLAATEGGKTKEENSQSQNSF